MTIKMNGQSWSGSEAKHYNFLDEDPLIVCKSIEVTNHCIVQDLPGNKSMLLGTDLADKLGIFPTGIPTSFPGSSQV
jgi:hypothetical protein